MGNWLGRVLSLALVAAAFAWAAPPAHAEDVFLIVSLEPEFDTTLQDYEEGYDYGSGVLIVNIGTLTNNVQAPAQTRFLPGSEPPTVPVDDVNLDGLDGNESTIFGSFTIEDFDSEEDPVPHLVTPGAVDIDPEIQAGVFAASAQLAALVTDGGYSSTGEIADIVKDFISNPDITHEMIAEALFGSTAPLGVTGSEGDFSCEAEGELFPHPKNTTAPLFAFEFSFDSDGNFSGLDVCLLVEAEVKEKSVSLKKKGNVSIAIYSSDTFDSDEIDEDTVEIDGVLADKVNFSCKKATAQFDVKDLVDAGVLTKDTEEITIKALLTDGSCIEATIPIHVK
ncbi:MAG TPA: hypothetical protein VFY93_10850 [Planctomycetota bacterium]|nr:hypothetical protein [Planctomycetota bacterium]